MFKDKYCANGLVLIKTSDRTFTIKYGTRSVITENLTLQKKIESFNTQEFYQVDDASDYVIITHVFLDYYIEYYNEIGVLQWKNEFSAMGCR